MIRFTHLLLLGGLLSATSLLLAPRRESVVAATLTGDLTRVHDPSRIMPCEGKYYLYMTGKNLPAQVSTDRIHWTKAPDVLAKVPDWARAAVPAAKNDFVWAPDVIFWNGKYQLYYSYSTFGSRVSVIGLLTNPTLNPKNPRYAWKDEGLVVASTQNSDFNAIDPAPIEADGALYLALGSWQKNGIKVGKLDENGKIGGELVTLAAGQSSGPEAPYLHFRNGVFTLFENEGTCCAGMNSGYRVMMGQSKSISGPYLDKTGRDLAKGGGSVFMETEGAEIGPGHIGIISEGGLDSATYHFYDGQKNGAPTLGMRSLWWDEQGWPRAARDLPGGRYAIESKASGLVLGVSNNSAADGTPIDQFRYGGAAQTWNVAPTGDGFYSLRSTGTGKFMDLDGCSPKEGAKIGQYPWLGNDCQRWRIEPTGENSFRIVSKGGKTALTLPNGAKTPQLQIVGSTWKGDDSQQWIFRAAL